MKEFKFTVTDPVGIHARPAGLLVKAIKEHASTVMIENKEGKAADAKKLLALMGLGIKQGDEITVKVEGADEDVAAAAIEEFLKANL